jgi:hypothetical protein
MKASRSINPSKVAANAPLPASGNPATMPPIANRAILQEDGMDVNLAKSGLAGYAEL